MCAVRRWSRACLVSGVWRRGRGATVPRLPDSQSYRHASWRCAEPPARSYWVIVQAYGQWTGSRSPWRPQSRYPLVLEKSDAAQLRAWLTAPDELAAFPPNSDTSAHRAAPTLRRLTQPLRWSA